MTQQSSIRLHKRHATLLALASAAYLACPQSAPAADGTWNVDANDSWNTTNTAPWLNGIIASGADATAYFDTVNITADRTVTLGTGLTIGHLVFEDDTTSSHNWIVNSNTLTLDASSGAPTINVINRTARINSALAGNDGLTKFGSGTLILNGANTYSGTTLVSAGTLQIGADSSSGTIIGNIVTNATLRVQRGNAITLAGDISGTGTLQKNNSAGVLTLTGNNSYSGGTTLTDGAIILGSNNALGTGTITVGRGRITSSSNDARTLANTISLNISGNLTFGASQGATDGLGNLTFTDTTSGNGPGGGNSLTVNNSTVVTLNKQFSGAASQITKAGTGTLVLNGSSTYGGGTTINGGTLLINNITGSGTGTGTVTVAENAFLGGTGSISGAVTLNGDTTDADLFGGGIRPLSATDPLAITGSLTLGTGSVLDLGALSGLNPATTYTIVQYAGTQLTGGFTVQNPIATHQISYDAPNEIRLIPVPEPGTIALTAAAVGLGLLARKRRLA